MVLPDGYDSLGFHKLGLRGLCVEEHLLVALALVGGQVVPVALGAALLEELLDLSLDRETVKP